MYKLNKYAIDYKFSKDPQTIRNAISLAIVDPKVDEFINMHKDGWQGTSGEFARVLCVCLMAVNVTL